MEPGLVVRPIWGIFGPKSTSTSYDPSRNAGQGRGATSGQEVETMSLDEAILDKVRRLPPAKQALER
jgi:hypothetical protein